MTVPSMEDVFPPQPPLLTFLPGTLAPQELAQLLTGHPEMPEWEVSLGEGWQTMTKHSSFLVSGWDNLRYLPHSRSEDPLGD